MDSHRLNSPNYTWSTDVENGSVTYDHDGPSNSDSDLREAISRDKINDWLYDRYGGPGLPGFSTTSVTKSIQAHEERMRGILEAPILAYPLRRPVPGENRAWCKITGQERSQPARPKSGGVRKASTSQSSSSHQSAQRARSQLSESQILGLLSAESQPRSRFVDSIGVPVQVTSSHSHTLLHTHHPSSELESSTPLSHGATTPIPVLPYCDATTWSPQQLVSSQRALPPFGHQDSLSPFEANVLLTSGDVVSRSNSFDQQTQDIRSTIPDLGFSSSNSRSSSSPSETLPTSELSTFFDQPDEAQIDFSAWIVDEYANIATEFEGPVPEGKGKGKEVVYSEECSDVPREFAG
ncbi:hypothetical protein BDZ45DRAFT_27832 [Acephala macrosclerotiorum]|nr:hypothetical protein BDZ45DRAFT_27832 [Acephala macrosclerotiorum]